MKTFRSPFQLAYFTLFLFLFATFARPTSDWTNANAPLVRAQETPTVPGGLLDFSSDGGMSGGLGASLPFVGGDAANLDGSANAPLTVVAEIAPVPSNANADALRQFAAPADRTLVGFLTIQTKVESGWHIYSPTQGAGGAPTKFKFDPIATTPPLEIGEIRLATPVKTVEQLGDVLEELFGTVDWIAPIFVATDGAPTEIAAFLADAKIEGNVDALACSEGAGGSCFPQKIDFVASFASQKDAAPIADAAFALLEKTSDASQIPVASFENSLQTPTESAQNEISQTPQRAQKVKFGFLFLLINAFLGGLILNATPCVLPVIGLKILSFFEQAGRSRAKAFLLNVWYALGVSIVFGALALASVGLSALFTRALFQILMSSIVFAMALSLMGVWELQVPAFLGGEKSNELTSKEGALGAIFKGIITTLLAIPCGAPLLSPVLDWASETTRQGEIGIVVVVYLTIGLGMASPFLLAGAFPELLKFFPKPGAWMETFRKTMGYFLLIAVVWILYSAPLEYQLATTAFLFAIWFACWNIGRNQFEFDAAKKKRVGWAISLLILLVVGVFSFNFAGNPIKSTLQTATTNKMTRWAIRAERDGLLTQKHWKLFDQATLDAELAKGKIVAVDFTADWCMNCKFLEKTILHTPETTELFDAKGVVTLTADWTNQNGNSQDILEINALLDASGARQVPKLMIFSPADPQNPIVLSGLYTKNALVEALETAEKKQTKK